jgi:hypothetical protein
MIEYSNMSKHLLIGASKHDRLMVMKVIFLVFALVLTSTFAFAEDWTTTDGINYQNVKIIRVEDDAVTILYKDGGALVPLFKLPPALQQRFGYDPVKAKAAAEARAKADNENSKELQAEIELANKMKQDQAVKDAAATNAPSH